jgi:hypothetical protein
MMSNGRLKLSLWCACALAIKLSTSCVYSADNEVALNTTVSQDKSYAKALTQATRSADVINNFEMRYRVKVTRLAPDFRTAFAKRFADVYRQQGPVFEEADAKTGFFVSIMSPEHKTIELENSYHWNIFLTTKAGDTKPAMIKKLNDKLRWSPFFDFVDPWSQEYLVVFDTASGEANSGDLVEKNQLSLTFANADAKVSLVW